MGLAGKEDSSIYTFGDVTSLHNLEEFLSLAEFWLQQSWLMFIDKVLWEFSDLVSALTDSLNSLSSPSAAALGEQYFKKSVC